MYCILQTVADLLEMDAYTMAAEIIDSHGDSKVSLVKE